MRDKPGFEHLNEPLHVLVEAELPANIIDSQLIHAREILQELLKPVVSPSHISYKNISGWLIILPLAAQTWMGHLLSSR
jgi:hypothetical protein